MQCIVIVFVAIFNFTLGVKDCPFMKKVEARSVFCPQSYCPAVIIGESLMNWKHISKVYNIQEEHFAFNQKLLKI